MKKIAVFAFLIVSVALAVSIASAYVVRKAEPAKLVTESEKRAKAEAAIQSMRP